MADLIVSGSRSVVKPDPLDLESVFREGTRQLVYLDTSASMTDYLPSGEGVFGKNISRGHAAIYLLVDFLADWPGASDLYHFSSRVWSLEPKAKRARELLRGGERQGAAEALCQTVGFNGGDTQITAVFRHAAARVESASRREAFEVLLLTDGYDVFLQNWRPDLSCALSTAVRVLVDSATRVNVFHIVPRNLVGTGYEDVYCVTELRRICEITAGRYVQVHDAATFQRAMIAYRERTRLPESLKLLTDGGVGRFNPFQEGEAT